MAVLNKISERNPMLTWIVVNALNVVDALLTEFVVERGLAFEGNPVVGAIGLNGKVVLVALLSAGIAFLRPSTLWIPAVALGVVVAYTTAGMVVFG